MDSNTAKEKITELTEKINCYAEKYYDEDAPEITDFEYDMLVVELRNLKREFPEIKIEPSRDEKIGGKVKEGFSKITHKVPLQSLQDVFSIPEVSSFLEKIEVAEEGNEIAYVVETKIDGLSVSLEYENGIFVRGATRGDRLSWGGCNRKLKNYKNNTTKIK